jgi:hypothetical protein
MTPEQLAALKAHIDASPDLSGFPLNSDGAFEIAALLNLPATPEYLIWKDSVTEAEILQNGMDWLRVDNLSVGKARIWEWLFKFASANPSKANVRAAFAEVWKGTAADNTVRLSVFQHCQKPATRCEKLFSTGAGTTTTQDGVGPATATWFGSVSYAEVEAARRL